MKIKDYVTLDDEVKSKLERITTFAPERKTYQPPPKEALSPLEQTRIKEILPEAEKISRGEVPDPVFARVYLSYTCRHNCIGCLYSSDQRSDNVFMDSNNFEKLLVYLHSLKVKFIDLSGGEPTLHPEFGKFVRRCMKEKLKLSLFSNGTWSDQGIIDLLIEGFSFLRVNLDASNNEVYDQIHRPFVPREFQKILSNLEKIVSLREKRKSDLIVGAKARLGQANMNFVEETINLVRDIGVDYIQFQIKNNGFDSLRQEQIRVVNEYLRELKSRYYPFLIYEELESKKLHKGCGLSSLNLIIDPQGDVYSCPHFPSNTAVTSFGNVFTQSAEKLWFGSEHMKIVDNLKTSDCPIKECRWHFYNELVKRKIIEN